MKTIKELLDEVKKQVSIEIDQMFMDGRLAIGPIKGNRFPTIDNFVERLQEVDGFKFVGTGMLQELVLCWVEDGGMKEQEQKHERKQKQKEQEQEQKLHMTEIIDDVIEEGGTWERIVYDLQWRAKQMGYRQKITTRILKKHIKYRLSTHPGWLTQRHLKMTNKGIAVVKPVKPIDKRQSIVNYLKDHGTKRYRDIKQAAKEGIITASPKSISSLLSDMVWMKVLIQPGKGLYSVK